MDILYTKFYTDFRFKTRDIFLYIVCKIDVDHKILWSTGLPAGSRTRNSNLGVFLLLKIYQNNVIFVQNKP